MLDLNEAQEQRPDGIIPDGTFVKVVLHLRDGGVDGDDAGDQGLLKASKSGETLMLDCELTVTHGPHAKRKIWQLMTVKGGKLDERGASKAFYITKDTIRAMVESARNIQPADRSENAQNMRRLPYFRVLDGLEFAIKVGVEFGGDYPDKNKIARVVVPSDKEYQTVMDGGEVPPKPSSSRAVTGTTRLANGAGGNGAGQSTVTPAWQTSSKPSAPAQPAWGQAQPTAAAPETATKGPAWLNG